MPTTQAEKRAALAAAGIDASHVSFVPVDFALEDWFVKLLSAGFDASAPTLFLWEGVTYYLTDEVIESTMRRIASCACALIAYDVYYRWFSIDARTVALMNRGYGEPFLSGVEPGDEGGLGTAVGMEVFDVTNAEEANRRYVPRRGAGGLVCPAFVGIAMAITGTSSVHTQPWSLSIKFPYAAEPMLVSAGPPPDAEAAPLSVTRAVTSNGSAAACSVSLESLLEMVKGLIGDAVDADASLMQAGLDSILTVEFTELVRTAVGQVELPATLVFHAPTLREVAAFISNIDPPDVAVSVAAQREAVGGDDIVLRCLLPVRA